MPHEQHPLCECVLTAACQVSVRFAPLGVALPARSRRLSLDSVGKVLECGLVDVFVKSLKCLVMAT